MRKITRRTALGLLGGLAAGGAGLAWANNVIPPLTWLSPKTGQPLLALNTIPLPRFSDGPTKIELKATLGMVDVAGTKANLYSYNQTIPGPLLRLREGEPVQLRFNNATQMHTNLHFHGLHISPEIDDPFRHGHPGEILAYNFTVPKGQAGTYWYHPHSHGEVASQLFSGLAGPIVIEGPLDRLPELAAAEEHVLVLKDLSVAGEDVAPYGIFEAGGKKGNWVMVNGAVQPVLTAKKATLRLRLLNACTFRYFRLSLEGATMHLIATDDGFIEKPVALKELVLSPGERAEVMIQLDRPGNFRLLDNSDLLMTIAAPAQPQPTDLPAKLATIETLDPASAKVTRQIVLTRSGNDFKINGQTFLMSRIDFKANLGDLEIWEVENQHSQDHSFHLHTFPFQVLSQNGTAPAYRAWKDTIAIAPRTKVRLAVPLRDFTGLTVFHCHLAEHEDHGMMGTLEVI